MARDLATQRVQVQWVRRNHTKRGSETQSLKGQEVSEMNGWDWQKTNLPEKVMTAGQGR